VGLGVGRRGGETGAAVRYLDMIRKLGEEGREGRTCFSYVGEHCTYMVPMSG